MRACQTNVQQLWAANDQIILDFVEYPGLLFKAYEHHHKEAICYLIVVLESLRRCVSEGSDIVSDAELQTVFLIRRRDAMHP